MDFALAIDLSSQAPRHRQVYDAIRSAILTGRLVPGDRLPPTRSLARELSLSRMTVAEAYDQLAAEGYLHARQGSGTYVAPDLPEDVLQPGRMDVGTGARESREPELSAWGRRIVGEEYDSVLRRGDRNAYQYDLRPHRVAGDLFPWQAWKAAVERALERDRSRLMDYPPVAGHPDLRDAIASHVSRYRAVTCSADQVVIVNGSQQGINLLSLLLLETGDHVAVEDPGYPAARMSFEARGLQVTRVPVDAEGMIIDELARHSPQRLVHVTPSHQDPTGATMSLARRLALLELAERTGCIVLEDDYDSEFRYEGRPVESLEGLDRSGLVVYSGTFSKSVLAGLRVGYLILPRRLVAPFIAAKSLWDSGTPIFEQAVLAEFMQSGDFERHIRRMRRLYRSRRDALLDALKTSFGPRCTVGHRQGGLNVLVTLNLGMKAEEIVARASDVDVGLRSAATYYSEPPVVPTFLLGFATLPEPDIEQGVRLLALSAGVPLSIPGAI